MSWRHTVGQKLRHVTPDQAARLLRRIQLRGHSVNQPVVRELTGGESDWDMIRHVTRELRRLSKQDLSADELQQRFTNMIRQPDNEQVD